MLLLFAKLCASYLSSMRYAVSFDLWYIIWARITNQRLSGAAEGITGLALNAVSVAALFTTCIECSDIVVTGRNFSEAF